MSKICYSNFQDFSYAAQAPDRARYDQLLLLGLLKELNSLSAAYGYGAWFNADCAAMSALMLYPAGQVRKLLPSMVEHLRGSVGAVTSAKVNPLWSESTAAYVKVNVERTLKRLEEYAATGKEV